MFNLPKTVYSWMQAALYTALAGMAVLIPMVAYLR
jgi:hypothetical protein